MSTTLVRHIVANETVRAHATEAIEMNGRDGGIPYEDVVSPPCTSYSRDSERDGRKPTTRQFFELRSHTPARSMASPRLAFARARLALDSPFVPALLVLQFTGYATSLGAAGTVYFVNNAYKRGFADSDDLQLTMAPSTNVLHLSGSKSAEQLRAAHRWASAHHCRPASFRLKCIASGHLCGGGRYKACKPSERSPDVY